MRLPMAIMMVLLLLGSMSGNRAAAQQSGSVGDVSFKITGSRDFNRVVEDGAWRTEVHHTDVRYGPVFRIILVENSDSNLGVHIFIQNIPTSIEPGYYPLKDGLFATGREDVPTIRVRVGHGTFGNVAQSLAEGALMIDEVGETLSGGFVVEHEDSIITGRFSGVVIPDIEPCYFRGAPQDGAIAFTSESDASIVDLNIATEAGYFTISSTNRFYGADYNPIIPDTPRELPKIYFYLYDQRQPRESTIIYIRDLTTSVASGVYPVVLDPERDTNQIRARIESNPLLDTSDRQLVGTLNVERGDDTLSGSFSFEIVADRFATTPDEIAGTIEGSFSGIPIPADTCRVTSWD